MKKNLTLFLFVFLSFCLFAQNRQIIVGKNYTDKNKVTLVTENPHSITLRFDMNELNLIELETEQGKMYSMESGKAPLMLEAGKPELLYLPVAITVPETGSTELQFVYGDYTEINNVIIAPSKGNLSRSIDPTTVPYQKGDVYEKNEFFPGIPAVASEPFIMRDVRGASLFAYPVQYNPVTKTLRVYSEITITAIFNDTPGANELKSQRNNTIEPTFQDMYNNLFINSHNNSKDYPTGEEGELLIICFPEFMDAMKPFVNWKRTIGRETTIVSTFTTGATVPEIKAYITDYYNNPEHNLAYVLLVGDVAQIPTLTYGNSANAQWPVGADNYYGQIVGNDRYMEVLIGRMSAENIAQVETQVQRSIWYERDVTTSDTWIPAALGIATNEGNGGHDGGEIDYVHMNKIRTRLLDYGYAPVHQEYGSGAGVPTTSITQISQRLNDGVSIANYCNHGSETAWTLSSSGSQGGAVIYSTTEVGALQNTGKLPFIFSVACLNGRFMYSQPCFAESWLRSTYNGQPVGAVATQMATISIAWAPPMTAQDEFVNICMDIPSQYAGTQPGIKRTFAGATMNATQKMLLVHGVGVKNTDDFDAWTVFGDPTLMLRTKTPQELTVTELPHIILEHTTSFTIECNAQEGVVALTYKNDNDEVVILNTAVLNNGTATITIDEPLTKPMDLNLTITAKNYVTYRGIISAIPIDEPYLYVHSYNLTGNADFGKTVGVKFKLSNASLVPYDAQNVTVKVTTESPYATFPQSVFEFPNIAAGTSYISENDLLVKIAEDVPNKELIVLDLLLTCKYNNVTYERNATLKFEACAPQLDIKEIYIENMNGARINQYNANAANNLVVVFENNGAADLSNLNAAIATSSEYLNIAAQAATIETLEKGESGIAKFLINAGNAPAGTPASVVVRASSGALTNSTVFMNSIGVCSAYYMSNETLTTAFANFYDTGGPNNTYSQNENIKLTFLPQNAGKKLKISFLNFDVENNKDFLYVYDGVTTLSSSLIATLSGSALPQDYEATNSEGALTFAFKSNATTQLAGWAAIIYETENYHNLSFTITDENNAPVTDAKITFDGYTLATHQFEVTLVTAGTHNYTIKKEGYETISGTVKVENGDEEVKVKLAKLSVQENGLEGISIYPNPTTGELRITNYELGITNVEIFDIYGKKQKAESRKQNIVDISNLATGVYFIKISTEAGELVKKVVKQ